MIVIACDGQIALRTAFLPTIRRSTIAGEILRGRAHTMGSDRHKKRNQNRLAPFVPLLLTTLDSPAWRDMSYGARSLYVALKRRYNQTTRNNGRIYLSQRDAAKDLNSHPSEIARWFRELQHYGFIVLTSPGCLGVDGQGKAPHWRLSELGYMNEPPTRDFARWDEKTRFRKDSATRSASNLARLASIARLKKTESRIGKPARSVKENQHSIVSENQHSAPSKRVEKPAHTAAPGVSENQHISRLPYPSSLAAPPPVDADQVIDLPNFLGAPRERSAPHSAVASERGGNIASPELTAIIQEKNWARE